MIEERYLRVVVTSDASGSSNGAPVDLHQLDLLQDGDDVLNIFGGERHALGRGGLRRHDERRCTSGLEFG